MESNGTPARDILAGADFQVRVNSGCLDHTSKTCDKDQCFTAYPVHTVSCGDNAGERG
jgi:hypothetical protein